MTLSSLISVRALTTILWLGAFICSLYIVNAWQLGFFVGAVFLLALWAWVAMSDAARTAWAVPKSYVLGFAAAFWALTFVSIFWSELPLVTLTAFCFFSALPLTFLVFVIRPDEHQFRHIASAMMAVFAVLGVWAMVQYCIGYDPFGGEARHPLADPNALGGFFNLALIPAVAALLLARRRVGVVILLVFIGIMFGGILATGSRGALLALLPSLVVLLIGAGYFARAVRGRLAVLAAMMVALCVASQFTGHFHWTKPMQRIADTVTQASPDLTNNRMNVWEGSWRYAEHHWIHGTGFGTFFLYYPEFRTPAEYVGVPHAHNDPLQYMAELGVLGPLLFYAFVFAALGRSWKVLKLLPADDPRRVVVVGCVAALGALVIQAHVNFNFYNLCILFTAGFLLAVWFVQTQRVLGDKIHPVGFAPQTGMAARRFFLALPFIPVLYLLGSYMLGEHFVNRARDALLRDSNIAEFANNLVLANAVDRGLNYRTWLLAANIPLGILQDPVNTLGDEKKKELYEQAMGQLFRARALNPRSSSVLFYLGKLQTLVPPEMRADDAPDTQEMYKEALRIDPLHLGARMALADIYVKEGKEDAAYDLLKAGLNFTYAMPIAMDYYMRMMVESLARGEKTTYEDTKEKIKVFKRRTDATIRIQNRGENPVLPVGAAGGL